MKSLVEVVASTNKSRAGRHDLVDIFVAPQDRSALPAGSDPGQGSTALPWSLRPAGSLFPQSRRGPFTAFVPAVASLLLDQRGKKISFFSTTTNRKTAQPIVQRDR